MIIIMRPDASAQSVQNVVQFVEDNGLSTHLSAGSELTIIGVIGDKERLATENLLTFDGVDRIVPVSESYKLANKKFHPAPTTIHAGSVPIGPGTFTVIAGPCAVESEEQILSIARAVKASGAKMLRGGAYKPRTSPYSFQGLEVEGLKLLKEASAETGLATVTEVVSQESIESAARYVDMLQIGARNMQNFILLKEVGRSKLPVLLKRGMSATIEEWLNAAEYIMSEGNPNVVLCERGIRTYETATRNTLDISAIPVLRDRTHLPVVVDPSHATGHYRYIASMAKAACAAGADGLEIEAHGDPAHALSDGAQSLNFERFDAMMKELAPYAALQDRAL